MEVVRNLLNYIQSISDEKIHNEKFIPEFVKLSTNIGNKGLRVFDELKDEVVYEGDNYKSALDNMEKNGLIWQSNKIEATCVKEVYLIHDNIFFSEENANSIQDGKGTLIKQFIILTAGDLAVDGSSSYDYLLFSSNEEALEEIQLRFE